MSAPRFDALVAIGDNLSIDTSTVGPQRGAASLLHRNRDAEWPDFRGRDMVTRDPGVRLLMLGQDGATARATLSHQMKRVPLVEEPVLVTITSGSRDLLALLGESVNHGPNGSGTPVEDTDALYETLTHTFEELVRRLSDAIVFVANLPDPGREGSVETVTALNATVADVAREQGASLIDVHAHFQGHGPGAGEDAWLTDMLDPTLQGAHEIRRLFWQALMEL